jgi:hypothetical protein
MAVDMTPRSRVVIRQSLAKLHICPLTSRYLPLAADEIGNIVCVAEDADLMRSSQGEVVQWQATGERYRAHRA